jgi:outer membrane protein assembly factor BamB
LLLGGCDWPMFRYGPTHTGFSKYESHLTRRTISRLRPLYVAPTGDIVRSAATVVDGVAYVTSFDGNLYAYDAAGKSNCGGLPKVCAPLWSAGYGGTATPAVVGGVVYVPIASGFAALDAVTGAQLWTADTGYLGQYPVSSPTVANGVVYLGATGSKMYAWDAAGNANCSGAPKVCLPLRTFQMQGYTYVRSTPAVDHDRVYVGSWDHNVYAFDAAGIANCAGSPEVCTPLWIAPTGGVVSSSPSVAGGTVYIASQDGNFYALDSRTGTQSWTAAIGGANLDPYLQSSPAVANGVVYIGSRDTHLYAFDASGMTGCAGTPKTCAPLWTAADVGYQSSPAVAGGVVYTSGSSLYALDANGIINCGGTPKTCAPLWSADIGRGGYSDPTVANGRVYVGSDDNQLHAFALH